MAYGSFVFGETVASGGMTAEERALGFPQSTLATHTERRAIQSAPLASGSTMIIRGDYAACSTYKGALNEAARSTGATIIYEWPGGIWVAMP